MDAKEFVGLIKPKLVTSININGHLVDMDGYVAVTEYEGNMIMLMGEEDHWYIYMDLKTGEVEDKADDSIYNGEVFEIDAKDIFDVMNGN